MTAQATPIAIATPKVELAVFTHDDDVALNKLIEKRRAYYEQQRKVLRSLMDTHIQHYDEDGVVSALIEHAEEFIHALKVWE